MSRPHSGRTPQAQICESKDSDLSKIQVFIQFIQKLSIVYVVVTFLTILVLPIPNQFAEEASKKETTVVVTVVQTKMSATMALAQTRWPKLSWPIEPWIK